MIPENLDEWNYELIEDLLSKNYYEGDRHDFKGNIPPSDRLSKTCCAFANSRGGFIVLGIAQKRGTFQIEGLDNDTEFSKKFGDKLKAITTVH
jgi:predicted HTH transcriptional regulator